VLRELRSQWSRRLSWCSVILVATVAGGVGDVVCAAGMGKARSYRKGGPAAVHRATLKSVNKHRHHPFLVPAAATTWAIAAPDQIGVARDLLAHSDLRHHERHGE